MKSLKKFLIKNGVNAKDIDSHESDLYCKKTKLTERLLKEYEAYASISLSITTFIDNINNDLWFDIAFGNMPEHYKNQMKK